MSNILMCGNEPLGVLQGNAQDIIFTPTSGGGLLSDNVQDAIEEVNSNIPTNVSELTNDSGYITTDNTRVSKSGDTMSGNLIINRLGHASRLYVGNDIPSGTANSSRGLIKLYSNSQYSTDIDNESALTADRRLLLPDKSGTMALFEDFNSTSLLANAYFPTGGQWSSAIQLSDDINNYVYLGFAWAGADNQYLSGLIEKIIDVGNFKGFKQSNPLSIWNYPISPSDSKSILVAYYDATHIQVYRGSEMYQYNRLWVTGLIKK